MPSSEELSSRRFGIGDGAEGAPDGREALPGRSGFSAILVELRGPFDAGSLGAAKEALPLSVTE